MWGIEMSAEWTFSVADVPAKLPNDPETMRFHYALRHGTMKVGLYAPLSKDLQSAHKQDELYVIVSGKGEFVKAGRRRQFGPHDVIFVEAGTDHHFEQFSPEFAAWVIFWGPESGER
jgi:mannose-6-phosphate isomerase-like protein (cupin superfamily)